MSSTRLPGKTLANVEGEPMLALLLHRLERARQPDRIVVATSTDAVDDPVSQLAGALGHAAHRGPRDDVLARLVGSIDEETGTVVRLTGDCPLVDPEVVDAVIDLFRATPRCAYASNVSPRTYPDGLDVEVVAADALRAVSQEPIDAADREHVTSAIRADPGRFTAAALTASPSLGHLRWTVDTVEDLDFVRALVRRLGTRRHTAGMDEILTTVAGDPELAAWPGGVRA
jgi:spore coat polysaccharide biosynthesis protein SpsF (cytidylyltransferase family)